jgi:hypothetical protein
MLFKKSISLFISGLIFFTIGCGLKTGEQKKSKDVAEIQSGTSCLKESTNSLKKFAKGEAEASEIDPSVNCISRAMISLNDNLRGRDKESFTSGELASFLKNNFMKGSKTQLTPEFLKSVMKFKVALVGGDTETIKKTEIVAISELMLRLKPELISLNPHMKIIAGQWQDGAADLTPENLKEFNSMRLELIYTLKRIAGVLAAGNRAYDSADLADLVVEIMKLSNSNPETIKKIQSARQVIIKTKTTLIGGSQLIVGRDWLSIGVLAAEAYSQVLRNRYFLNAESKKDSTRKIQVYQQMLDDVFSSMLEIMSAHGKSGIKTSELVDLMNTAKEIFPALPHPGNLIEQLSKVKVVLADEHTWGTKNWTLDDFKTLRIKFNLILSNVERVKNKFKPKNKNELNAPILTRDEFVSNEAELLNFVESLISEKSNGYDLKDLKELIESFRPLLGDVINSSEKIDKFINLLTSVKVKLTGEPGSKMTSRALKNLLRVGVRVYSNYVEFTHFVAPYKFEELEFTKGISHFLMHLNQTISNILNIKPTKQFTTSELTDLILEIQEAELIQTKLRKESMVSLFDTMWSNILNTPENRLSGTKVTAFTQFTLMNLSAELIYWIENQKLIHSIFERKPELNKEELRSALELKINNSKSEIAKKSAIELKRVVEANGYMNFNSNNFLQILTNDLNRYSVKDLSNTNLSKTLSRLLIRAYAGSPKDHESEDLESIKKRVDTLFGLTQPEITYGFERVRDLAIDLDLIDPKSTSFISGRFLEANLFLSVSDGDKYSSFEEMNHLILHIISGIQRANVIEPIAIAKCNQKESFIIREIEFNQNCLLNLYLEESDAFLDLPEFLKLKANKIENNAPIFSPDQNKEYFLSLLKAAGHIPNKNNSVLLADAALFPHVVQYVEMIFWRHDRNKDGKLDKEEALAAFTVFSKLLEEFTASKRFFIKIPDLPGLFIYLLKFGAIPTDPIKMKELLAFIKDHKCDNPEKPCQKGWDIQSSRHEVGRIFNYIADQVKPKPKDTTNAQASDEPANP